MFTSKLFSLRVSLATDEGHFSLPVIKNALKPRSIVPTFKVCLCFKVYFVKSRSLLNM